MWKKNRFCFVYRAFISAGVLLHSRLHCIDIHGLYLGTLSPVHKDAPVLFVMNETQVVPIQDWSEPYRKNALYRYRRYHYQI